MGAPPAYKSRRRFMGGLIAGAATGAAVLPLAHAHRKTTGLQIPPKTKIKTK